MAHSKTLKKVLRLTRKSTARLYAGNYRLTRLRTLKVLPGTKNFYDVARKFYEAAGFKRLGDYRLASMPRHTAAYRTPLRFYLSPDGEFVADAFYFQASLQRHIEMGFSGMPMPLTFDFTTEFADGGFLETSNATAASMIDLPKSVLRVFVPPYAPPAKILAAHRRELARQKKLGRQPRLVDNAAEMIASAQRLHELKSAFRKKIGHGSMREIKGLKRRRDDAAAALQKLIASCEALLSKPAKPARA